MKFRKKTLDQIADMICGNFKTDESRFQYRSSFYITRFFQDCETDFKHDGSTRNFWVSNTLEKILDGPSKDSATPSDSFLRVIAVLMDQADGLNEGSDRPGALQILNASLAREGFEVFYGEDRKAYLRNTTTKAVAGSQSSPHRPLTTEESKRRELLAKYLEDISEDELIDEVLLPLFRQIGFHRVTSVGHKDKALEYGKDIWMRFVLPTQHVLYFGLQVKKGKLDSAGISHSGNANVAEVLNQISMMIGHEIFDPEVSRKVLVDHVIIVAGGEITKAARNWLGGKLDATRRSQILFMDRDDILNLFVVTNTPLPTAALPKVPSFTDEVPF